jgi:hypothetical protein
MAPNQMNNTRPVIKSFVFRTYVHNKKGITYKLALAGFILMICFILFGLLRVIITDIVYEKYMMSG